MRKEEGYTYFGQHVVCLVDVLGQKDKLARWGTLPPTAQITQEFIHAVKETAGTVLAFRDHFLAFFDQVEQCMMPERLAGLPPDKQRRYWRMRDCAIKVARFSDTFLFYALVPNAYGDASVMPLYRILGACCMAMIVSLGERIPVRGAITVAPGAELPDGGFYGPALAQVHHLESEVAGHPRIVVSDAACMFLTDPHPYSHDAEAAAVMRHMADTSCGLVVQDYDGRCIVDFMGKGVRGLLREHARFLDAIRKAHAFVRTEAERFRAEKNDKLAERYARLQRYVESRLALWRLTPSPGTEEGPPHG